MALTAVEAHWIEENVGAIDFLNALNPQQVLHLIRDITPMNLKGSEPVIRQGEKGRSFFLIYNGRASVWIEAGGLRRKVATLAGGDHFGEIALLTGRPATADVITTAPTRVFFLDQERFIDMVRANAKLRDQITAAMEKRLREQKAVIEAVQHNPIAEISEAIRDFLHAGQQGNLAG